MILPTISVFHCCNQRHLILPEISKIAITGNLLSCMILKNGVRSGGGGRTRTYTPCGTDLQSVCFTQFAYSLIFCLNTVFCSKNKVFSMAWLHNRVAFHYLLRSLCSLISSTLLQNWWEGSDLNRQRTDFQSVALPVGATIP